MLKLLLSLSLLLFISCGGDDEKDDILTPPDSIPKDTSITDDSTDNKPSTDDFATDSAKFTEIKVSVGEKVVVEWSKYPDSNLSYYRVYYAKGETVSMAEKPVVASKDDIKKEFVLDNFQTGLYSFMVVAVMDDGENVDMIESKIESVEVSVNSGGTEEDLTYNPLAVDGKEFIAIEDMGVQLGFEIAIAEAGKYQLTYDEYITTPGFNPTTIVYAEDKSTVIVKKDGVNPVEFEASSTVFVKIYVTSVTYVGESRIKIAKAE